MSGSATSPSNLFIVKVAAARATKQKAILPGYRPDMVRVEKLDSAGDRWMAIAGANGTGANKVIKIDTNGALSLQAANGITFRKDGITIAGNAAAPMGVAGTYLVELIRDGYLGMPFVDDSKSTTFATGIPAAGALEDFKLRTSYETEAPWYFEAA